MIRHLYIKNFVLIDELNLDFSEGFSAFTGETGAGKSILIDAISILCGAKAGTSLISQGCDKAIVEGMFDLSSNAHALAVLSDAGFDTDDFVICTRELTSSGKSICRIILQNLPKIRHRLFRILSSHAEQTSLVQNCIARVHS